MRVKTTKGKGTKALDGYSMAYAVSGYLSTTLVDNQTILVHSTSHDVSATFSSVLSYCKFGEASQQLWTPRSSQSISQNRLFPGNDDLRCGPSFMHTAYTDLK